MLQSQTFLKRNACLKKERRDFVYCSCATLSPTNYVFILIIHFAECINTASMTFNIFQKCNFLILIL